MMFFIVSLFFPRKYKVERSVQINKPVHEVFMYMKDFKNWQQWSVWNKDLDSTLFNFYSRPSDTLGSKQYFNGALLGTGRFKINNYKQDTAVGYNLRMHGSEVEANGVFLFKQINNTTQLTWIDSGDVGYNPVFRYMIPSKVKSTSSAFDDGLKRIKQLLEK